MIRIFHSTQIGFHVLLFFLGRIKKNNPICRLVVTMVMFFLCFVAAPVRLCKHLYVNYFGPPCQCRMYDEITFSVLYNLSPLICESQIVTVQNDCAKFATTLDTTTTPYNELQENERMTKSQSWN